MPGKPDRPRRDKAMTDDTTLIAGYLRSGGQAAPNARVQRAIARLLLVVAGRAEVEDIA
jgi:hypothetical protein